MAGLDYKILLSGSATGLKRAVGESQTAFKKLGVDIAKIQGLASSALNFAGLGSAASIAGIAAMAKNMAATSKELTALAALSGTGVEEFQRLAYAAKLTGVEQDKLADIFKDVQDKVGDFLETGGGPMADFFENIAPQVGVTAEQFRNLSGPQALQLYVSSLEKANVSQAQMTFYLEAIASDSTRLLPMLRDNGKALREAGDEAERFGIMSAEMVAKGVELDANFQRLEQSAKGVGIVIGSVVVPAVNELAEEFLNARAAGFSLMEALVVLGTANPGKSAAEQIARITAEIDTLKNGSWSKNSLIDLIAPEQSLDLLQKELAYFQRELARDAAASQAAPPPG